MKVDDRGVNVDDVAEDDVDVFFRHVVTAQREERGSEHFDQQVEVANVLFLFQDELFDVFLVVRIYSQWSLLHSVNTQLVPS